MPQSTCSGGLVSAEVGVGVGDADGGSDRGGGVGVGEALGVGVGCALGVAAGVALGLGAGAEDPDGRTAMPFTFGRFTEAVKPRSSCPSVTVLVNRIHSASSLPPARGNRSTFFATV